MAGLVPAILFRLILITFEGCQWKMISQAFFSAYKQSGN